MSLLDDFKERFPPPEFSDAVADKYVPIYEQYIHCYWGGTYKGCGEEITLNLLAHLIVTEVGTGGKDGNGNGGAGPLRIESNKTVGSVSVGYQAYSGSAGDGTGLKDWLFTTPYGQRFWILTRKYRNKGFVV